MNLNSSNLVLSSNSKRLLRYPLYLSLGLLCGCFTAKVSEPPRTAVEQLLLSRASDQAMRDVDLTWLSGKKIFVEDKYFDSIDKGYAISLIREHLSQSGALLMPTNDKADVIVEIRSGGLGMNTSETLIGVPSLSIPVPLSGPLQTPEIAFYKSQKADSIGKFALFAYVRETGEHLQATGPASGYAHFYLFKIFGISWRRTDVPQLKKHADKEQREEEKNGDPVYPKTDVDSVPLHATNSVPPTATQPNTPTTGSTNAAPVTPQTNAPSNPANASPDSPKTQ